MDILKGMVIRRKDKEDLRTPYFDNVETRMRYTNCLQIKQAAVRSGCVDSWQVVKPLDHDYLNKPLFLKRARNFWIVQSRNILNVMKRDGWILHYYCTGENEGSSFKIKKNVSDGQFWWTSVWQRRGKEGFKIVKQSKFIFLLERHWHSAITICLNQHFKACIKCFHTNWIVTIVHKTNKETKNA